MENSTKCPVCGKEGITDYHLGDVRCQSCGSNLEVFRLLDSIEEENKAKSSIWKPVALASMALALLFAILYFTKGSSAPAEESQDTKSEVVENTEEKTSQAAAEKAKEVTATATPEVVQETTEKQQEKAEEKAPEASNEITAPANLVTVKDGKKYYTVKKGDTWSGIARKLYNGKVSYEELARMNNRSADKPLDVDEQLLVK